MSRKIKLRLADLRLERASRPQEATVTIDRDSGLISVRPLRSRQEYHATMPELAEIIVQRALAVARAEKKREKATRRRG